MSDSVVSFADEDWHREVFGASLMRNDGKPYWETEACLGAEMYWAGESSLETMEIRSINHYHYRYRLSIDADLLSAKNS